MVLEQAQKVIALLKNEGRGIIYISHRLEELSRIVDRVTILRDGRHVKTLNFAETSLPEIISPMPCGGKTPRRRFLAGGRETAGAFFCGLSCPPGHSFGHFFVDIEKKPG
jgi:ABC-type sugar transport system ATPase subunit